MFCVCNISEKVNSRIQRDVKTGSYLQKKTVSQPASEIRGKEKWGSQFCSASDTIQTTTIRFSPLYEDSYFHLQNCLFPC